MDNIFLQILFCSNNCRVENQAHIFRRSYQESDDFMNMKNKLFGDGEIFSAITFR